MGIKDDIKAQARASACFNKKSVAVSGGMNDRDKELLRILNRMFYMEKNAEEETKFVNQMITRGLGTQERFGLHASAVIADQSKYCVRQQVLSLRYKMLQGQQVNVGLMRIFEEGNAIHEKWQRLLIRAGYGKAYDMDLTQFDNRYNLSYTPDIICSIPEFTDGKMVGEIKSVNTFSFQKMTSHESAEKQVQLYMYLTGIHKGFILCEDKNTQEVKVYFREFDPDKVKPYVERLEDINMRLERLSAGCAPKRHCSCKDASSTKAEECPMKDACFNVGMGRRKLNV